MSRIFEFLMEFSKDYIPWEIFEFVTEFTHQQIFHQKVFYRRNTDPTEFTTELVRNLI